MFFKSKFNIIFSFTLLQILNSCAWINDKPKAQVSFQNDNLNLSCLTPLPNQLQYLFEGKFTESSSDQSKIKSIWTCLDKSLNAFASYTQGSSSEIYTQSELSQFANRYFPKEHPLSPAFTDAIFRLKKAVLGGSDQTITQAEIVKLRKKLINFGEIILPLSTQLDVLLHSKDYPEASKAEASKRLNQFVKNFALLLKDSENPLYWKDLSSFISELEKYTRIANPTALTVVREQIGLYPYLKLILVGGNEALIEPKNWEPIFKSFSKIYDAIFLSTSSSEILQNLNLEITSEESDRTRAVSQITNLLKILKTDESLYSKESIQNLADSWAKLLLVNSFLFSKSQGSIAIKTFFDSSSLRRITGYLLDHIKNINPDNMKPEDIRLLAEQFCSLIKQAGNENNETVGIPSSVSFKSLKAYANQLKPLLINPNQTEWLTVSLEIIQSIQPILSDKESDLFTTNDFENLIQKGTELYLAWKKNEKRSTQESIGFTLDTLLNTNSPYLIRVQNVIQSINLFQKLILLTQIKNDTNWDKIKNYIQSGFVLKAKLFGSSDQMITGAEFKKLNDLYEPLKKKGDLSNQIDEMATYLNTKPFASIKIEELISGIDAFLPENKKIKDYGFTIESIGQIKAVLCGGNPNILDKNDFTKIASFVSILYRNLIPTLNSLPIGFQYGLNSTTINIAELFLNSIGDFQKTTISYDALKKLIITQGAKSGFTIRNQTMDKLFIGFNHRVFREQKTPKPKKLMLSDGLQPETLQNPVSDIKKLIPLLEKMKTQLQELENAFNGIDIDKTALSKNNLLSKIKNQDLIKIINTFQPQLAGNDHLLVFAPLGTKANDYYFYDLAYKVVLNEGIQWLFPFYKIQADLQSNHSRLSMNDLIDLLEDINDAIFDFKQEYTPSTPVTSAKKRMQTFNLFMQTGNGDEYADTNEVVEFLTMAGAGKVTLEKTLLDLNRKCGSNSSTSISIICLTQQYFNLDTIKKIYQKTIPQLVDLYASLDSTGIEQLRIATLNTAAPGWNESGNLDIDNFETFITLPNYVENTFQRLDTNLNGKLEFSEAMKGFLIFCNEIRISGKYFDELCDPESIQYATKTELIYGHLLFRGKPPRALEPGDSIFVKANKVYEFLSWKKFWKNLDRDPEIRDREPPVITRKNLIEIISNLATTAPPPENTDEQNMPLRASSL